MSVPRVDAMTLAEFLAWDEQQETKYEFDGIQPIAMVGVTRAHAVIRRNLLRALGNRLSGTPCEPFGGDLKIEVAGGIRYPDVFVVCTPGSSTDLIVTDPVAIFEILSAGSEYRDQVEKNEEYRRTPSVRRNVMLKQDQPAATVLCTGRKRLGWHAAEI